MTFALIMTTMVHPLTTIHDINTRLKDVDIDNEDDSVEIPDFHFDWLNKPDPSSTPPLSVASSSSHASSSRRPLSALPRRSSGSYDSPLSTGKRTSLGRGTPSSEDSATSRTYGQRTFQRVVSAPVESSRNASTLTPAPVDRPILGSASTGRRLGLSRFGPARRIVQPEADVEREPSPALIGEPA